MRATPPGAERSWVEMLEEPWSNNPDVIVLMVPEDAVMMQRGLPDGTLVFNSFKYKGEHFGMQVLKPQTDTYVATRYQFLSLGVAMPMAAYEGPLADIPQKLLQSNDFLPVAFRTEKMGSEFTNLRAAGKNLLSNRKGQTLNG